MTHLPAGRPRRALQAARAAQAAALLALWLLVPAVGSAQPAPVAGPDVLTRAQMEELLAHGKIVKQRGVSAGTTGTVRVTLTDGTLTHDASVQTIDEYKPVFTTARETELDFRDTYRFNIAAYRLAGLLGLDSVPATVGRDFEGKPASFTWWVDDVLMDEGKRLATKTEPPDMHDWNQQMWTVRVFDQLIFNTDRNLGNLLIDKRWKVWMIDHTRAFRRQRELRGKANLTRCEEGLFTRMKALDAAAVAAAARDSLAAPEIEALLARRDLIVAEFEAKGPAALFRRPGAAAR